MLAIIRYRMLSKNLKIKIYRTIILPDVLFETWSLTLMEEQRPTVLAIRVLRIFGPKKDEVTRERRKLYNVKLNDLYSSPNIIRVIKSRRMRWAELVARMGRGVYRILVVNLRKETTWEIQG